MHPVKGLGHVGSLLLSAVPLMAATLSPECDAANREAIVLLQQGRIAEAEAQLSPFVSTMTGTQDNSVCTGVTLGNMAYMLEKLGKRAAAEHAGNRSVKALEEALGPDSPALCRPLLLLARLRLEEGRVSKAAGLLSRIESLPIQAHDDLAFVKGLKAVLLEKEKDFQGAAAAYRESIAEQEGAGGGASPDIVPDLANLGMLYLKEGRTIEAVSMLERAWRIVELHCCDASSRVRTSLALAVAHTKHRNLEKAESYFRQAMVHLDSLPPILRQLDGRAVYCEYATFLRISGRKREAKTVEERASALFGPDTSGMVVGVDSLLQK